MKKSDYLAREAEKYLVGGVNSPVRSFRVVASPPLLAQSGEGPYLVDVDGRRYLDYVLSWGAALLGHAHPAIVRRVQGAVRRGLSFGVTHTDEITFAGKLTSAIPSLEQIRLTSSGTEAVMGALRVARGFTGRTKILKFEGSYHGHADYLLAWAGSGLATHALPFSQGVPEDFLRHTLIAPYGDSESVERIFKKLGRNIAAVIVEPIGANAGVVGPDVVFLKELRRLTRQHGSVLIFDEVVTAFRQRYGAAADGLGITPDLMTLGKVIGGGLPVGAFGGSRRIMRSLSPLGPVYQASTFAGHPVVMQAGLAALQTLEHRDYGRLNGLTGVLCEGLQHVSANTGVDLEIRSFGSMFSLSFKDAADFILFYKGMLEEGVFFAPSAFEANFLSFAHTRKEITATIAAAERVFKRVVGKKH